MFDTDGNQRVDKNEFLVVSESISIEFVVYIYIIPHLDMAHFVGETQYSPSPFIISLLPEHNLKDYSNPWRVFQAAKIRCSDPENCETPHATVY